MSELDVNTRKKAASDTFHRLHNEGATRFGMLWLQANMQMRDLKNANYLSLDSDGDISIEVKALLSQAAWNVCELLQAQSTTPTVTDHIAALAVALGHDPVIISDTHILESALAELARLKRANEILRAAANDVCAEYGGAGEVDALRELAQLIDYPGY